MALGTHIMMRLVDGRVIAPTVALRRELACVLLQRADVWGVTGFAAAYTHLHVSIEDENEQASRFIAQLAPAVRRRLKIPVPFERANTKPIVDQRHHYALVRYFFRQEQHHGLPVDPLHEASSLPDLLGLRVLDSTLAPRLAARLPRLQRSELVELLGLDPFAADPDPSALVDAAAAAFGLPDLTGCDDRIVAARLAAVHACPLATVEVAELLGISTRSVRRLRARAASPVAVMAVQLQLRARGAIRVANTEVPLMLHA